MEKPGPESIQLLADGHVDGFIGFPPEPQELRARKIGRLIVSTTVPAAAKQQPTTGR